MATLEQIAAALQTGTAGQALGISAAGTVEAITVGGGGTPSSATPQPIGTATAGASTDYSRGDHVHAAALADLSDVAATAPTSGQVLAWGGSEWAPATVSGGGPWQESGGIISPATSGDVVQIDVTGGAIGVTVADSVAQFDTQIKAGTITARDSGAFTRAQLVAEGEASLRLRGDTGGSVTPQIVATDFDDGPSAINLVILDLQINGAAGGAGDVLTSQGGGAAPIWAPAASGPWQVLGGIISPAVTGDTVSVGDGLGNETTLAAGQVNLFRMTPGDNIINSSGALDVQLTAELKINSAAGSAGEVLTSNGAGTPPTWQAASGLAYIDRTINVTTTDGSAPNFTNDHQVSGLDPSAAYLVDSCIVDNVGGSATQLALCAATVPQTAGVSTPTTQQQAAIMGAWNSQLTISSLPPVDGLTGTYAGPRQGFGSSITLAPAVVVTDSAGRLNLRAFTGTNGGSFRAKIRLRKVSA